jgi:hypothetical protein
MTGSCCSSRVPPQGQKHPRRRNHTQFGTAMSRMFGKACCGSNDGATMSPAWTQAPATSALLPSTPGTARRVSGTAPHGPHLELEPLPADLQLLSPGKMSRSWAPNDENTTPVVGARPAAPLVLAHGEWGPKAWQSPTRRSNRVEAAGACVKRCRSPYALVH